MSRFFLAVLAALMSVVVVAEPTKGPRRRRPPHPQSRPSGGIIEKDYHGKVFRVLNAQNDFSGEKLAQLTKKIRYASLLPIEYSQTTVTNSPFAAAESLVSTEGVGAGAVVVNDPTLPIVLVSPDRRWGIFNIAPLKADNPAPERFEQRFTKVYWGIIARTLGAGTSSFPGCVLVPFTNMNELDAIAAIRPCPEPFNKMIDTGKSYGINTITISTYRGACQQGWAPQPANELQKKIWDEVHQLPTSPIKIAPESKKVKD